MDCEKFLKSGGGRGRPGFDTPCASCKVRWADHPKNATAKKPSVPRLKTLLKIKGMIQPVAPLKAEEEDDTDTDTDDTDDTPTSLEVEKLLEDSDEAVKIEEEEELPAHKQPLPARPAPGATPIVETPKTEAIKPPVLTEAEREAKVAPLLNMFQDQASTDDW